jgi:hypothetical protein
MRKIFSLAALTLASGVAFATDYGFLGYFFTDPDHPIHVAGRYRQIAPADFETHSRGDMNYADAYGALFLTQFFDDENSLSYGLGYNYMKIDWEKNPRFSQTNFNYAVASLGYVSTTLERWRWILNAGITVDAERLDFAQTGVFHSMLWGRYHFNQSWGAHVGILGWYGIKNGYALPIFGVDWRFASHWTLDVIFPLDFSLNYAFNNRLSLEVAYSTFGGPYRYPHRAHGGRNGFHDPIFEVYSRGADLNFRYKHNHLLRADIGIGWDFGGWILVRDHNNRHGKYFHYESAPYAQATLAFTF